MPGQRATAQPLGKLRRIALDRQGLLGQRPFGTGPAATLRAIQRLGYVQIDTISVVSRAHHHVLRTRVPDYRPDHLDLLQAERKIFEYWSHAAAYLPMADYRFALPKMRAMARGEDRWIRCTDTKLMARVLDRVKIDGPLQARDFDTPGRRDSSGWWSWKPAKQALEQLFMEGRLMISGRQGFQKIYDLPERLLPAHADVSEPSTHEYAGYLIRRTLDAHGFAGVGNMTYLRRSPGLRDAVTRELAALTRSGDLATFTLADAAGAEMRLYARPETLASRAPAARASARVLSPFDNAVIQRRRNQSLFDFDYQLECYLPAHKRRYGYFCLPLLYRDRFIGRADCKARRPARVMEIRTLFVEDERPLLQDAATCMDALAEALAAFALFNGCTAVDLVETEPWHWREPLQRATEIACASATPDAARRHDRTQGNHDDLQQPAHSR